MAITTYRYPLSDDDYKARIKFTTIKAQEVTPIKLTEDMVEATNRIDTLKQRQDQLKDEGKTSDIQEVNSIRDELEDLNSQLREFEGQNSQTQTAGVIQLEDTSVELYLPAGIQFRDNVSYENFDLGTTGAFIEGGMGIAQSMMNGIGSFVEGLAGSANTNMAKLAGTQLASKFGAGGAEISGALKLAGGVTVNPNTRTLFKQSNIRDFSYTFKMIAKSAREAEQIKSIVKHFRTELYPDSIDVQTGSNQAISIGYVFPKRFQIEMLYNGEDIPGIGKILPCYLRDVSTSYNTTSMAFHADGNVLEVDMTLSFQEEKPLMRKDVEKRGY